MTRIDRRKLLVAGGAGAVTAASSIAAPAVAETLPELKWRITSSFPKSLDTIFGAAETFSRYVSEATDGKFQIQVFPPGELAPALEAANEVGKGSIEMCHTASYYFWGKDPTFALATAVPFGLNARMQNGWMYYGGGIDLLNEFYATHNLIAFPCGNTGAQMGGWFRDEIKSVESLSGLKMRIGGFGGKIISKLGVVPQQIPGPDIYSALEKGTIDAAEWVGPYDDKTLKFHTVAKNYYYPGWWEGGAMLHTMINLAKWNELPKGYQAAVRLAAQAANCDMMARYDALNPVALRELVGEGAKLRPYPADVMEAAFKAAMDTYAELSGSNAAFKKVYEAMAAFRANSYDWLQLSEITFDRFMIDKRRKKAI